MSCPAPEPDSGAESLSSDEKEVTPNGLEGSGSGSAEEHPEGEASSEDSSSSSSEEESDEEQEEKESPPYCNESGGSCLLSCEHCRNENPSAGSEGGEARPPRQCRLRSVPAGDAGAGVAFTVLHVQGGGAAVEPSAEFSSSHVKWVVSSLSPVGPLIRSQQPPRYHGAVILYKAVDEHPSLSFWVYLATNNDSFIKDISKAVKHSKRKFVQIEKPPVCQKLLQEGKKYRLICEPEAEITPEEIEFVDGSLLKLKSYFEVYLEKPDDFTLSLGGEARPPRQCRLRSVPAGDAGAGVAFTVLHVQGGGAAVEPSAEFSSSHVKWVVSSLSPVGPLIRSQQPPRYHGAVILYKAVDEHPSLSFWVYLATNNDSFIKLLDRSWREMAIECLQMEMKDIDDVRAMEEDVTMQKLLVLRKWREREQGHGTAEALQRSLGEKATYEILQALQGFLAQS
ncbi:hypothetical protein RLOC_00005683 [Lonchura striata]|uniref:Caspase recruitment domain-containing protein 8 n=1 Tax=Lonchura striata TaxID=40157 RepID=A0A218UED0_9PASE|nr:hypothetical protein RLOC_00005683 [Lonchura striata domestica]